MKIIARRIPLGNTYRRVRYMKHVMNCQIHKINSHPILENMIKSSTPFAIMQTVFIMIYFALSASESVIKSMCINNKENIHDVNYTSVAHEIYEAADEREHRDTIKLEEAWD